MDSVLKSDIVHFLHAQGITPKTQNFRQSVTTFLLEQFGLSSYQIEPKVFKKLEDEVIRFQDNMIAFSKKTNKKTLLTKHKVGFFSFLTFSFKANSFYARKLLI